MTAPPPPSLPPLPPLTYLAQPLARDALRLCLGEDASILPLPTDEAGCKFLRGQTLVLVPLSDKDRTIRSTASMLRLAGIPCSISPVSAEWFLSTLPPDPHRLEKLLSGVPLHPPIVQPHLDEVHTSCEWLANYQRIEIPMVLEDLLPAGIVAGLNAEGGTGKTYILIALFAAIATGTAWGPFKPTRPHKTLLLLAEDPQEVVSNRIFDIASAIVAPQDRALLLQNFHVASVRGLCGPLMALKEGNPIPTEWMDWLEATLDAHPNTEVLGLDPLRKFYGLDENKNEFAHAFIGILEAFCQRRSLLTIYAHHIAKAVRGAPVDNITGRGAGGLSDNCRWTAAMRVLDSAIHADLGLEGEPWEYVEFSVTKSNYAARLPTPAIFRRGQYGVLYPMPPQQSKLDLQSAHLSTLIEDRGLTQRDLCNRSQTDLLEAMKDRFRGFKRTDLAVTLKHALATGFIEETMQDRDGRGRHKMVLTKSSPVPF